MCESMTCEQTSLLSEQSSTLSSEASTSKPQTNNLEFYEYETQFFGFTPKAFVDGVHNALVEYLCDGVTVVEQYLMKEFKITDGSKVSAEKLRECTQKVYAHLKPRYSTAFDKLEFFLIHNLLHIPSHVVLPEDKVNLDFKFNENDEDKVDREIAELRTKIENLMYVNHCLAQSIKDMKDVQSRMENLLAMIEKIEKVHKDAGITDLKETVAFNLDKMNKIIGLTGNLMLKGIQARKSEETEECDIEQRSKKLKVT
ncbi:protein MIS12 homolog [Saccoglossus kowalevskii]|uniref:Protein MIS12 homolog n=1 Tax=Saccoglossus kowalevskii TaxID=10224 RepID=A0ABM0GRM8_SACKO|nr:PREDICTED: protein MIS12 homolog [Saccoglossus kowalevskii]